MLSSCYYSTLLVLFIIIIWIAFAVPLFHCCIYVFTTFELPHEFFVWRLLYQQLSEDTATLRLDEILKSAAPGGILNKKLASKFEVPAKETATAPAPTEAEKTIISSPDHKIKSAGEIPVMATVLKISPESHLTFNGPFDEVVTTTLSLENITNGKVCLFY